jgi:hypothetical protein
MKYESPIICHSKYMANVKVFADRQTDGRTGHKLYGPDLSTRGHKMIYYRCGKHYNVFIISLCLRLKNFL